VERRGGRTAFQARRGKEEKSASPERARLTPGKSTRLEKEVAGREDRQCTFCFCNKNVYLTNSTVMIDIFHVIKINGGIMKLWNLFWHKYRFITEYF
jgi:hypothetical protein